MKIYRVLIGIISSVFLLSACAGTGAGDLSSRTGIEYREEQINNLTGLNAVVYHSDECTLWLFGDEVSASSVNGSDFPAVSFSYKGTDVRTGKTVLMLADSSYVSCVAPTLSAIFGKTLSASNDDDSSYTTGDYELNTADESPINSDSSGVSSNEAAEEPTVTDCGAGDVELEVRRVAKSPVIEVLVASVSETDCFVDLGPGQTRLSISDGNSWLWSSDECLNKDSGSNNVLLKAGQNLVSGSYEWDRSQSTGDGCSVSDTGNEVLPAGLYYFKAELDSLRIASGNKQFRF